MNTPEPAWSYVRIAQYPVISTDRETLARHLLAELQAGRQTSLFFANTNLVTKCRFLLEHSTDPSLLLVNDGVGMDIAAKLFGNGRFAANLNGTDFTPYLLQRSPTPLKVFLVGSTPAVLARAATHVREVLKQEVVGYCDGFDGLRQAPDIAARINQSGAQVVLVAMGNPLQERWVMRHRAELKAGILMGVGALFDFWAGDKARAPQWVQRLRLEWLYRLYLEPRRLLRRYTLDILLFLRQCYRYR